MVNLIAGVIGISPEIFEAAEIDGANRVQTFFKVTIPCIRQIMLFVLVTSLIGGLNMFDIPQLLVGPKAANGAALTTNMYIRNQAFDGSYLYNRAAAASVILFLVIANSIVKGIKELSTFTVQMKASEPFGIEILYTGLQIIPYLTFVFREQLFGFRGALVLVIVSVLFLVWHGSFNLSLLFLGYRQYRVKTENSTIWLVSMRKISNFSSSELVHTLQDNVFVRHE